jgi:hypothetical protein
VVAMNLNDLKIQVDLHHPYIDKKHPEEVVIQLASPGIGATPCVGVAHVTSGFDWDHGKIFLVPEHPLVKQNDINNAEREFIVRAIERGYRYICRCANGDLIISQHIPVRTTRSWKYDKKCSERTSLYRNEFKKITFENGGVMALSCLIHDYNGD